jgi:hypothetical protein
MESKDFETQLAKTSEAKNSKETDFLSLPNVCGVGIGYKEVKGKMTKDLAVNIFVEKKVDKKQLDKKDIVPGTITIPETNEDVVTDVIEIGVVEALAYTARIRPAKPGYSIGHFKVTAGTFGCLVRETCNPCHIRILSNNHVLANSNAASIGDPILQPGRVDGGTYPADLIARLSAFVPIHFGDPNKYNLVDAALARPNDIRDVIGQVVGLGLPRGTEEATLGMDVVKSGRTTQTTAGRVTAIDATVAVGYGSSGVAYYRNQIMTTDMSKGGDSGSLLMSRADRKAVGLLFAGSNVVTIHNYINNVSMALGVEVVTA